MTPDAKTDQDGPANDIGVMRHAHSPDYLRGLHEGVLLAKGRLEDDASDRLEDEVWLRDAFSELENTTQRALKSHAVKTHESLRRLVLPPKPPSDEETLVVEVPARLVGAVDRFLAQPEAAWRDRQSFVEDAVTDWLKGNLEIYPDRLVVRDTPEIDGAAENAAGEELVDVPLPEDLVELVDFLVDHSTHGYADRIEMIDSSVRFSHPELKENLFKP